MKRWRAAVLGCGWIGSEVADDPRAAGLQAHAAAYAYSSHTELVGVADADAERASKAARRWNLEHGFGSLAELVLRTQPELLSICTPDATHAPLLREALTTAGIAAIIAEKPLALSLAEARSIAALARERGVLLAVNYVRRYSAVHADAKARIAAGDLGTPLTVAGTYTKGVRHNGTHWFDLAQWLLGPVARVQAWPGVTDATRADPTCHVRLQFANGATGYLAGLDEDRYSVFEMEITGSGGRLRITDSGMRHEWSTVADSPHYSGYRVLRPSPPESGNFANAGLRLVENAVAALEGREPLACSAGDAVAALAVADAAVDSLRGSGPVDVTLSSQE